MSDEKKLTLQDIEKAVKLLQKDTGGPYTDIPIPQAMFDEMVKAGAINPAVFCDE